MPQLFPKQDMAFDGDLHVSGRMPDELTVSEIDGVDWDKTTATEALKTLACFICRLESSSVHRIDDVFRAVRTQIDVILKHEALSDEDRVLIESQIVRLKKEDLMVVTALFRAYEKVKNRFQYTDKKVADDEKALSIRLRQMVVAISEDHAFIADDFNAADSITHNFFSYMQIDKMEQSDCSEYHEMLTLAAIFKYISVLRKTL